MKVPQGTYGFQIKVGYYIYPKNICRKGIQRKLVNGMKILSLYRHIIPLEWNSSGEVHRRQKVLLFFPVIMWGHVFQVPAPQLLEVNHGWTSSSSFYFFSTSQKIGKTTVSLHSNGKIYFWGQLLAFQEVNNTRKRST